MKTQLSIGTLLLATLVLFTRCTGKSQDIVTNTETEKEKHDTVTYTALGYSESYEPELTIFPKDTTLKDASDLPEFDILHVIPDHIDEDSMGTYMHRIYGQHFELDGLFKQHTGGVRIFYDKSKKHDAVTFMSVNGKPDGKVIVYTQDGDILMERDYDKGNWIKSGIAPACSDWRFDPSLSNLEISDLDNGTSQTEDSRTVVLMPSLQESASYEQILAPSTYKRPFLINNEAFTGQLLAHTRIPDEDHYLRFELNFKDGLLHGTAKVYEEFAGLVSEEQFNNGLLIPEILPIEPEPFLDPYYPAEEKPVIYLYPETTTALTVKLDFDGKLTHTYPKYEKEWKVTAHPDGTLIDTNGQEYYALYWEGESPTPYTLSEGNVIKGEETIAFLETALATLGLNRREANEFIMYWLPRLENNAYNLIHFSTDEYEAKVQLNIDPAPETLIRVMMVFQPLKNTIDIPEQNLESLRKTRKGFTVVEWGGQEVQKTKLF